MTVIFSILINQPMMLIQTIQQGFKFRNAVTFDHIIHKFSTTDASYRFLGRYLEIFTLNDSHVGSGQPTEIKTKNLVNILPDIETDLRKFEKKSIPKD
jgi:hypothetical protein